jgi:hypothetical protein
MDYLFCFGILNFIFLTLYSLYLTLTVPLHTSTLNKFYSNFKYFRFPIHSFYHLFYYFDFLIMLSLIIIYIFFIIFLKNVNNLILLSFNFNKVIADTIII